jgi:glycosyltransferase involved in cell wall biosynthesis
MGTKVAFWPHTTSNAVASYRIRCAQVRRGLAASGVASSLYRGRVIGSRAAPDILVLSKNTRERAFEQAFALKRAHGTRVVLDISDNVYFGGEHAARAERLRRLTDSLRGLDAIVTPSAFLDEAIAARVGPGPRRAIIPDAVEPEPEPALATRVIEAAAFRRLARLRRELAASGIAEGRRLVWYGISGTRKAQNGLYDFAACADLLEQHNRRQPVSLTVITDSRPVFEEVLGGRGFATRFVKWNFWTFNACVRLHDVAVLPIRRNDYNWAKSANRLTTAFANGVAVCASTIPSYEPFRDSAVLDDFEAGLARLMEAKPEREARIRAARAVIEAGYTLRAVTGKWIGLLADLAEGPAVAAPGAAPR